MKSVTILIIATMLLAMVGAHQAAYGFVTWAKTYGTAKTDDIFRGVTVAADNPEEYILAGQTDGVGNGGNDGLLVRVNINGTAIWQRAYGTGGMELFRSIKTLPDGYILAGATNRGNGKDDILALRLDLNGDIVWQKAYGSKTTKEFGHAVATTIDGGFVFGGYTDTFTTLKDFLVVKADSTGHMLWQHSFGGNGKDDVARIVAGLSNGNVVAAGWTKSFGVDGDILVVMMDSNGNKLWSQTYGGGGFEEPSTIIEMPNGSITLMEESRSFGGGGDGWIFNIKISDGSINWQKVHGANGVFEEFSAAVLSPDGNTLTITGETRPSRDFVTKNFMVTQIDANTGNLLWARQHGSSGEDSAEDLAMAPDGSIITAGYSNVVGSGGTDIWAMRLNPDGFITGACNSQMTTMNSTLVWHSKNSTAKPVTANVNIGTTAILEKNTASLRKDVSITTLTQCEPTVEPPVNTPPVALDDRYTVIPDTTLTVAAADGVLKNDTDLEQELLTAVIQSLPSNGTLTFSPDGGFEYTPDLGFIGIDTFTYKADDGQDLSNLATVELRVGG